MIWQTQNWQNMLEKSNQVEKSIKLEIEKKIIFIEKRKISLGETALFILGFNTENFCENLEKKLIEICKKEKSLFIQIETFSYKENIFINSKNFKRGYFKNFITPFTAIIDLNKDSEEIFKNMKPKGRYNIKLTEKKGVEIKIVEKTQKNIKIFYDLMQETVKRDKFSGQNQKYFQIFLENLPNSEIIFAYKELKVIAGGIFTFSKKTAIYYYGVSTSEKSYRNLMAPYGVQWKAIQTGKEKGCEIYDFLGISNPKNKNDDLRGVTNFKLKFTKDSRQISENYIFINKKLKYFIMKLLRKVQKKIRG